MKVIGAGLPRTATLTQKIALEMLGFGPCYHMYNILGDLSLVEAWQNALRGEVDWEQVFHGYNATVDYPGSFFYRDLIEAFPDAKVVLSVRDSGAWARSIRNTLWTVERDPGSPVYHLALAASTVNAGMRAFIEFMENVHKTSGLLGPSAERFDTEAVIAAMERHNAEVRARVPAGRLLEWSPADGWAPLCEFLEVPVPEAPLPWVNDSGSFLSNATATSMNMLNGWWAAQPPPPGRP